MLKGHVFSRQLFGNPIFALFINTFLNGKDGISDNYKNGMALSYSGTDITIQSGAVCIQGRFVEEDTYSTISAGNDIAFCKLVIEIDLDKQNTESELNQVEYKIIKNANAYPSLIQTNIVKNNAGVYQYELARFKTTGNGITDFQDKRTFLDFNSIYDEIEEHIEVIDSGSLHVRKSGDTMTGKLIANGGVEGDVIGSCTGSSGSCSGNSATATKLKNAKTIALSGGATGTATNFDGSSNISIPVTALDASKLTGTATVPTTGNAATATKLATARTINGTSFNGTGNITTTKWGTSRTISVSGAVSGSASVDGSGNVTINVSQANIAILTGSITINASSSNSISINYPTGYTKNNSVLISNGIVLSGDSNAKGYNYYGLYTDSSDGLNNAFKRRINLNDSNIKLYVENPNSASLTLQYKIVLMKVS